MRLRLWLPPLAELRAEAPIEFEVIDAQRRVRDRGRAVLSALPKAMDCELVLDALDAVLLEVKPPKLSRAKLAKALPALVEERIVGDLERNHLVATERDSDGKAVVAAVDRGLLGRALEIFERAGRRVVHAVPQPLALAATAGVWRVRWRDGKGSVRTGHCSGLGFASPDAPPLELRLLLSQSVPRPTGIEVQGDCDTGAWSEALGIGVQAVAPAAQASPVVLDLLQHGFSRSIVSWRAWRTTIVLGAILLLAALGGLNLQAWTLRAQEKALRETMTGILKESFPQVSAVLDPVAQMRRLTADLRTGSGTDRGEFLSMAISLGQTAAADSVQSIEYRDGRGTVRFRPQVVDTVAQRTLLSERAAKAGWRLQFAGDIATLTRKEVR